jgi:hypothetical protein
MSCASRVTKSSVARCGTLIHRSLPEALASATMCSTATPVPRFPAKPVAGGRGFSTPTAKAWVGRRRSVQSCSGLAFVSPQSMKRM